MCADWYSNFTFIPGEPVYADADWRTSPLRTYFWHDAGDKLGWNAVRALRKHPWRAPGQVNSLILSGLSRCPSR